MAKAVLNHDGAKVLLDSCEETQLSLVWRENNLLCKGRLDGLSSELKTVIDLKKCQDASPDAFARSIATYGYHRQGAMYLRGATYHGIDVKNYVIIAVEESEPHAVALYTLTERQPLAPFASWRDTKSVSLSPVEYGNHELLRLLDLYERCEATGEWPGYAEQPVPISLPGWVMSRIEREG
jgi:exodeoxyribonuclease VIII